MSADRYFKNTLQLKFRNNVEVARYEATDRYLSKTLMGLGHLFLLTIVGATVLLSNKFTAQQNKIN
jgi:hypothetical protein